MSECGNIPQILKLKKKKMDVRGASQETTSETGIGADLLIYVEGLGAKKTVHK